MSFKASTLLVLLAAISVLAAPVRSAPAFQLRHEGHDDSVSTTASASATAAPAATPGGFSLKQNALDAQKLNAKFKQLSEGDACDNGEMACINGQFAQCAFGKWQLTTCAGGLRCYALPLVNRAGTTIVCDTQEDSLRRFEAAGVTGGTTGNDNTTDTSTSTTTPTTDDQDGADDCDDDVGYPQRAELRQTSILYNDV
ncbi:hypothetical protein NLJ89_g11576 [Agrocybe chaxingu]|uniref:Carbohydrate-binding module family 19 domain-containing protein n=1 Tax=Agrocybe chaxingu TaxID=84603 RepID=A0A9W8MPW2_9AGAR|nr:hypothetical protein NLJ89_g11576 [Agrocybe chaxingu]